MPVIKLPEGMPLTITGMPNAKNILSYFCAGAIINLTLRLRNGFS
jgi:hypothetical protein